MKGKSLFLLTILIIQTLGSVFDLSNIKKECTLDGNCSQSKQFNGDKDFGEFVDKYYPQRSLQCYKDCLTITKSMRVSQVCMASCDMMNFPFERNQPLQANQPDIIETDGTYIYTISGNKLFIVHAYSNQKQSPVKNASVISTIALETYAHRLFIYKDVLAVFGSQRVIKQPNSPQSVTFVSIYNVSDRSKPIINKNFTISGDYTDGRTLENGLIYLVTKSSINRLKILPWYDIGNGKVACTWNQIYWFPLWIYQYPSFMNIIAFDLKSPQSKLIMRSFVAENVNIMYMSKQNIYLAQTQTEHQDQDQDKTRISKIVVDRNSIRPIAFAIIRGTAISKSSFSEYKNYLRVATTNLYGDNYISSNVFVLNYYLKNYGQITQIAPNQSIYSCRFVDKKLYMVTYMQPDQFFIIDLSYPSLPKILGQLKISGFKTYLHPYDDNTIVGLGNNNWNVSHRSLKISIFNVTNPIQPTRTAQFTLSQKHTYSEAEFQHKAFLIAPHNNLLVIPAYSGAFLFFIAPNIIILQSLIPHFAGLKGQNLGPAQVERSISIKKYLYTKSSCRIVITEMGSYKNVETVPLCS